MQNLPIVGGRACGVFGICHFSSEVSLLSFSWQVCFSSLVVPTRSPATERRTYSRFRERNKNRKERPERLWTKSSGGTELVVRGKAGAAHVKEPQIAVCYLPISRRATRLLSARSMQSGVTSSSTMYHSVPPMVSHSSKVRSQSTVPSPMIGLPGPR